MVIQSKTLSLILVIVILLMTLELVSGCSRKVRLTNEKKIVILKACCVEYDFTRDFTNW